MISRTSIVSGGVLFGGSQILSNLLGFSRNLILVRLLSPADIGISAIFAMTLQLFEMTSDLNTGTLLVQAPAGEEPAFQATVQAVAIGRGMIQAATLFLLAGPIANAFHIPQAAWTFRWLAIVPAVRNCAHADVSRLQRGMAFLPAAASDVGAQTLALCLTWPVVAYLGDYSAILWLIIIQWLAWSLMTHIFARRAYRLRWDKAYVGLIMAFGVPLLFSNLLWFAVLQGDRLIIASAGSMFGGAQYSLADLGMYYLAASMTAIPIAIPARTGSAIFLPALAKVQNEQPEFCVRYARINELYALLGAVLAIPLMILGGWISRAVYGQVYAALGPIIVWLGAMQGLRLSRGAMTLAAIARGDTRAALLVTAVRASAMVGVLALAWFHTSVTAIASLGCLSEAVTLVVCAYVLRWRHNISLRISLEPVLIGTIGMCAAGALSYVLPSNHMFGIVSCGLLVGAVLGLMVWHSKYLYAELIQMNRILRGRVVNLQLSLGGLRRR